MLHNTEMCMWVLEIKNKVVKQPEATMYCILGTSDY